MKQRKVLSYNNLPARIPLIATIVWWMFLDYVKAPGWAFGAVAVLLTVAWIAWAVELFTAKRVELES